MSNGIVIVLYLVLLRIAHCKSIPACNYLLFYPLFCNMYWILDITCNSINSINIRTLNVENIPPSYNPYSRTRAISSRGVPMFYTSLCKKALQDTGSTSHVTVLKNSRLSQKDLSSRIRPTWIPSSDAPACIWGSNHIGKEKANHANTQAKPNSLKVLDSLYPRRWARAITTSSNVMPTAWRRKNWMDLPSEKFWESM